jgi:nanoRNase/pAp phosphatase (c-di-AMP/oligoRNAs hydrolase)
MKIPPKTDNKTESLVALLKKSQSVLIVMQDNPDPDSIAAALGLRKIANSQTQVQCTITYGGAIGRAENKALVRYLSVNIRPFNEINLTRFDLFCMVDTQPGTGNNSLPEDFIPDIVIDHHPINLSTRQCVFTDIRRDYGATSTIICEYLKNLEINIDTQLATALLYGIRSDTQDLGRETIKADMDAIYFLYPIANKRMLSQIQRGSFDREYFQFLANALKNARVYQNSVIITRLENVNNPDMIGEVADLLLRDDNATCTISYGFSDGKILISVRTSDENLEADKMINSIVGKNGTGGGHKTYAGGQIPVNDLSKSATTQLEQQLYKKILKTLNLPEHPYAKLINI